MIERPQGPRRVGMGPARQRAPPYAIGHTDTGRSGERLRQSAAVLSASACSLCRHLQHGGDLHWHRQGEQAGSDCRGKGARDRSTLRTRVVPGVRAEGRSPRRLSDAPNELDPGLWSSLWMAEHRRIGKRFFGCGAPIRGSAMPAMAEVLRTMPHDQTTPAC